MNLTLAYSPAPRPLGSGYSPGVIDMVQVDNDNQIKESIINQVFPLSERRSTPGFNASALQVLYDALNNGYIRQYYAQDEVAADCSKARSNTSGTLQLANKAAALLGTGIGLATGTAAHASILATLGLGVNVAPVVGQVIAGAIAIFAAVSAVFQHHTLAVQEEQTILCSITPKLNDALQGLDNAVANGQITLQDAFQGLQALQAAYLQSVQPILKNTTTACNAACVIDRGFVALFMYKAYQYQKYVAASPAATVQNTIAEQANSIAGDLGLTGNLGAQPNTIIIYVVLAVGLFLLLRR